MGLHTVPAVNLRAYQQASSSSTSIPFDPTKEWTTLGDLHGNALKLVHVLHMFNILDIDRASYMTLVQVYAALQIEDEPTEPHRHNDRIRAHIAYIKNLPEYQAFLNVYEEKAENFEPPDALSMKIVALGAFYEVLPNITVKQGARFRAIGDMMGDRGANDLLTLELIGKLIDGGVELEILLSNHDMVFIQCMEGILRGESIETWKQLGWGQAESLRRFVEICTAVTDEDGIDNNPFVEKVFALYAKYKKVLKAVSYDFDESRNLLLYTHAHVDEQILFEMVKGLLLRAKTDPLLATIPVELRERMQTLCDRLDSHNEMISIEDTMMLADFMNVVLEHCAQQNRLTELYEKSPAMQGVNLTQNQKTGFGLDPAIDPFRYLCWNRDSLDNRPSTRPKNPNIVNVHGHHTYGSSPQNPEQQYAVGLDNSLGHASTEQNYPNAKLALQVVRSIPYVPKVENAPVGTTVQNTPDDILRAQQLLALIQELARTGNIIVSADGHMSSPQSRYSATVNMICLQIQNQHITESDCQNFIQSRGHDTGKINATWSSIDKIIEENSHPNVIERARRSLAATSTARMSIGPKATTNGIIAHWTQYKTQNNVQAPAAPQHNVHRLT